MEYIKNKGKTGFKTISVFDMALKIDEISRALVQSRESNLRRDIVDIHRLSIDVVDLGCTRNVNELLSKICSIQKDINCIKYSLSAMVKSLDELYEEVSGSNR